jgi:hypothetical protein
MVREAMGAMRIGSQRAFPARFFVALGFVGLALPLVACTGGAPRRSGFGPGGSPGSNGSSLPDGDPSTSKAPNLAAGIGGTPAAPKGPACAPAPGNFEIPGNGCDDDADGMIDNVTSCDSALAVDGDATQFARALGVCKDAETAGWGLVSALFTNTHAAGPVASSTTAPNPLQHGILPKFGAVVRPREGASLGVLSSGFAREFDDATGTKEPFKGIKDPMQPEALTPNASVLPAGFPQSAMGCPSQADEPVNDVIVARLAIKVPANAQGVAFDFSFWSGEWPDFVCSLFNDAFVAYLTTSQGSKNISFDAHGSPVSVNNGFFDRCTPNAETGCAGDIDAKAACAGGTAELEGTGFANPGTYCGAMTSSGGGSTGWLSSLAPVTPGETITLELMIFDVADANFDSSVLVDNLRWIPSQVTQPTTTRVEMPR